MSATSPARPCPIASANDGSPRLSDVRARLGENAEIAIRDDPVRIAADSSERRAGRRVWRALVVARDLETFEALLRGEAVPIDRLDPEALGRFVPPAAIP